MHALVLGGAGAVCKETTRDLAQFSQFDEITIADVNLEAAERLVASIADARLKPVEINADDENALRRQISECDIVVNGLPFKYDYIVNKVCVELGVNGLDLSSDDPQFALHDQAIEKDMLFVPGMGATPGITNLMVRRASEVIETLEEVEIYFAAFRCLAPAPGLLETTLWEFNPDVEERKEVYFQDGTWHPAEPMSGGLKVSFHEHIGQQTVYYVPHDESNTLPRSFPGLRRAAVRGCFPPQVMDLMGALYRAGLLSNRLIVFGEKRIPSIDLVRRLLAVSPSSLENPIWAYGLVVQVAGKRDGRQIQCTYRSHHPNQEKWGGESAYFKNVGIPLSIGAQLIASNETTARGVQPPELAFPTQPFFNELARRGITVEETVLDIGVLV